MKLRNIAVPIAALSLLLAACTGGAPADNKAGGDQAKEITFQTWSLKNDRFTPYFQNLVASFEKENPGTKVNWIDQPGDGYEDKILQQADSNELPDVVNLPPEFAYKLAQVNMLVDLEAKDSKKLSEYVEGATNAYRFPDIKGQYGYAWYLGTDLNWFNTKYLKEAGLNATNLPTDLDQLFDMAKKVAKATNGKIKMIADVPRTGSLSSAGVKIIENGKFVFNSPDAVKVVQRYKDAYAAGAMPPEALNADYLGNSALYKQGKTAWTTASAGFPSELEKEAPTLLENTVSTPRIGHPPLFIQGISVSAKSKAPDLALKFAQYVTNNANQIEFLKIAQGFFPGTKEGNSNPESFTAVIKNPLQKKATEQAAAAIGDATPEYPIQFTYDMDKYLQQQVALAVKGDIPIQEALDKAADYANKNLAK